MRLVIITTPDAGVSRYRAYYGKQSVFCADSQIPLTADQVEALRQSPPVDAEDFIDIDEPSAA